MIHKIVVMGVSGSGKSTLATALARRLHCDFIEGDQLHSVASLNKMAAGIPLDDADRWPWLDRIGQSISAGFKNRSGSVATCSALRKDYRDRLRSIVGSHLRFVMIDLPREELEQRVNDRPGHFMPPALLDSQLIALERPNLEPDVLVLDGRRAVTHLLDEAERWLVRSQAKA